MDSQKIGVGASFGMIAIMLFVAGNYFLEDPNHTYYCNGTVDGVINPISWCDHLSGGKETRCYLTSANSQPYRTCVAGWEKYVFQESTINYDIDNYRVGNYWCNKDKSYCLIDGDVNKRIDKSLVK